MSKASADEQKALKYRDATISTTKRSMRIDGRIEQPNYTVIHDVSMAGR